MMNSIFDFKDYREYLKCHIELLQNTSKNLNQRDLAKQLGFKSHSYINLIIQGKRNLSNELAEKLADNMDLKPDEKKFFCALVVFNQAKTIEEKLMAQKLMFSVKAYLKSKPVEAAQYKYFSDWLLVVVREAVAIKGLESSAEQIAKILTNSRFSTKDVQGALDELSSLRLLDKSLEGKYFKKDSHIELPKGLNHSFVYNFHKVALERAIEALFNLAPAKREFSASTLTFNSKNITEVKKFLNDMRAEFIARFGNDESPDSVYQFNYQFFEAAQKK